jgi:hypothetical protein
MVEALHSFKKGWKRTGVKGGEAFEDFFSTSKHLRVFQGSGEDFYSCVRCGVLHQAETYDGWKIVRRGSLLDKSNKIVNATKFLMALDNELKDYVATLKNEALESNNWKKAIRKLDYICSNNNA